MGAPLNLLGKTFGRWTVVSLAVGAERKSWVCKCGCGNESVVSTSNLTSGASEQCRTCAVRTHGASRQGPLKHTYFVWRGMRDRCGNPACESYRYYGARGVYVCERWKDSFENFFEDMGKKPSGRTLDRVDNNGPYSPDNCRWATPTEQSHNSRAVRIIKVNGDARCVSDWARYFNVPIPTMFGYIRKLGDVGAIRHFMQRSITK